MIGARKLLTIFLSSRLFNSLLLSTTFINLSCAQNGNSIPSNETHNIRNFELNNEALHTAFLEEEALKTQKKLNECHFVSQRPPLLAEYRNRSIPGQTKLLEAMESISCALEEESITALRNRLSEIRLHQAPLQPRRLYTQSPPEEDPNSWLLNNFPVNSLQDRPCSSLDLSELSASSLNNRQLWHQILIEYGLACTLSQYRQKVLSYENNQSAQNQFENQSEEGLNTLNLQGVKFYIAPHFSYEKGEFDHRMEDLAEINPLIAAMDPQHDGEHLPYYTLKDDLESLGAEVIIMHRTTNDSLDQQMASIHSYLSRETENFHIISRSAGSHVVHAYLKSENYGRPTKLMSWFNVGGTPRGSVLPEELNFNPHTFFTEIVNEDMIQKLIKAKASILVPGIPRSVKERLVSFAENTFALHHVKRLSLSEELTLFNEELEQSWQLPIINLGFIVENPNQFVRVEHENPLLPPVYSSMMKYGPTEGSSLLADVAIDTQNSLRIMMPKDHYMFSQITVPEALKVYRRLLKTAQDRGLLLRVGE